MTYDSSTQLHERMRANLLLLLTLLSAAFITGSVRAAALTSAAAVDDITAWPALGPAAKVKGDPTAALRLESRLRGELRTLGGRFLAPVVREGVPEGVTCNVTLRCDSRNVCARVCGRGSVEIDPWLRAAMDYQWRLARRQPLCFAQLLGTHNSAITLADGYGMHDDIYTDYLQYLGFATGSQRLTTSNQALSLTDQLNLGVRFLELDVHWIQSGLHIAHCGGFHSSRLNRLVALISQLARLLGHPPVEWDAETVGCDPSLSSLPVGDQRSFADAVAEVAAWLLRPETSPGLVPPAAPTRRQRGDEFLVLYMDNQPDLQTWGRVGELLGQVVAAIPPDLIITPPELDRITRVRGSIPSIDELIHVYGKQLLLMSRTDYGEKMSYMVFNRNSLCGLDEPLFRGFIGPPHCSFHNWRYGTDQTLMTGRIVRTPTCHLQYGPYNCSLLRGENIPQLDSELLPPATSCGINVPAPDVLTPDLAAAFIWSWAPGHGPPPGPEPGEAAAAIGGGCVLMRGSDGRWVVRPSCSGAIFVACRQDAGPRHLPGATAWALADLPGGGGAADAAAPSCPPGYVRSAPHTARENWELRQLLLRRRQQQQQQRQQGQQQGQQQQQQQQQQQRQGAGEHLPLLWQRLPQRRWAALRQLAGLGVNESTAVLGPAGSDPADGGPADGLHGAAGLGHLRWEAAAAEKAEAEEAVLLAVLALDPVTWLPADLPERGH